MNEIVTLLQDYMSGHIVAENFVIKYLNLLREIRDEQWQAIDNVPGLRQALLDLDSEFSTGFITTKEFEQRWQDLVRLANNCRVPIGSAQDKILFHLFVEADAYEGDPQIRSSYQIGEAELREEVTKALEELMS